MVSQSFKEDRTPKISILTPSLNTGKYLVDTVESILRQSYKNYEHIVVDGGSTDGTLDTLKKYAHIKWVSEKGENDAAMAGIFRKALSLSNGKYIIQCCISDGFLDDDWFRRCVDILEANNDVSLIWGLPQYMTEEGELSKISYSEFFDEPPPQKQDFLQYWLATGFFFPEGNYCMRRDVFDKCCPHDDQKDVYRTHPLLGVIYNFNTMGYLPLYLPIIANYGRVHQMSRQIRRRASEKVIEDKYYRSIRSYRKDLLAGRHEHVFRNGDSEIIGKVNSNDLGKYRMSILKYRVTNSPFFRTDLAKICRLVSQRGFKDVISSTIEKLSHS